MTILQRLAFSGLFLALFGFSLKFASGNPACNKQASTYSNNHQF